MWDYSEKVKDYFFNPKNAGVLADANAVGEVGAIACGDALKLMLKVDPATEMISDARFQTFGCGSAIASSSALTELVIGKTLDDALALTNQDIADFLGGLPPEKMHCSVMGYEALQAAVANFRGVEVDDDHEEGALICKCFGVDEGMLERAIRNNNLTTIEAVTAYTKAGGGCLTCFDRLEETLVKVNAAMVDEGVISAARAYQPGAFDPRDARNKSGKARPVQLGAAPFPLRTPPARGEIRVEPASHPAPHAVSPLAEASAPRMTNLQRMRFIEGAIEELRPFLQRDGGDCELIDVEGDKVLVKLTGACVGCQMAAVTISGVQQKLVEKIGLPLRVIPVK